MLHRGHRRRQAPSYFLEILMKQTFARLAPIVGAVGSSVLLGASAVFQALPSPVLTLIDSVVLIESDTAQIGMIAGFAVARDGSYLLADVGSSTVLEFHRRGTFRRKYGRSGRGPGEFVGPSSLALQGDSTLLVFGGVNVQAFDRRTGRYLWQQSVPRPPDQILEAGGHVYFAALDLSRKASVGRFRPGAELLEVGGPLPYPYGRSPVIDAGFGRAIKMVMLGGDSLAISFHASEYLYLGSFSRSAFDSVRIAKRVRNGVPSALIASALRNPDVLQSRAYDLSAPWAVGLLSGNRIAVVSVDQRLLPGRLAGDLFVSVLDRATRMTCPDAKVPIQDDPPGYVALLWDTLFVAQQGESTELIPQTTVKRFLVTTRGCQWMR